MMKYFFSLLILFTLFSKVLLAANSYQVNVGAVATINEQGSCKYVQNISAPNSIFIATKTAGEWSTFFNTSRPGVTLTNCCALPWGGTILQPNSVTAYQALNQNYPATCATYSETRTCSGSNTLSGSYTRSSCSDQCSLSTGQSCTFLQYFSGGCEQNVGLYCNQPGQSVNYINYGAVNEPLCGPGNREVDGACNSPGTYNCYETCQ